MNFFKSKKRKKNSRLNNERGATMVEYALMAALLSLVSLGSLNFLGNEMSLTFFKAADGLRQGVIVPETF